MSTSTYLRTRVDPSLRTAILAVGDAIAIGAFVWAGEVRHGFPPLSYPARYLDSLAPFVLAWLAVAVLAGLYTDDATASVKRALSWSLPAWLVAVTVAHLLRASPLFHGDTELSFYAVTALAGGVLVVGWRLLASLYRRKNAESRGAGEL